jgi:hypothetical protein
LRQPEIHRRDQALSAGEKFRVVAMFRLERKCVLQRTGGDIFEGGRLHGARVQAVETRLARSSETPPAKYEAATPASQKIGARIRPSENPMAVCLTPIVGLAH